MGRRKHFDTDEEQFRADVEAANFSESDEQRRAQVEEAIQSLVKQGKVIDSGMRRRNPRTGTMDIVWVTVPPKADRH